MAVRVIWPTFGKSRKTTKSYPSTGDQFCESRKTAKFDAPVGLLGRVSRTRSNYDSLEETQWPCASFGPARPGSTARCGPVRPGPARTGRARHNRRRDRDGKDGHDDGRDHLCM